MAVAAGTPVPDDWKLADEEGGEFTRADLVRDDGVVTLLVFYPFAFSPVCTDQLQVYQEVLGDLEADGGTLRAVSCDATWSQKAFKEKLGISIPQLSDFEPKGAACRALDVLHPGGFPQRALIAVRPDGVVGWSHQEESPGGLPGANLLFDGLAAAKAA